MKTCSVQPKSHNLNIAMYSFQELLELFGFSNVRDITPERLTEAKKMVIRTHPDKSRLPPEYFLFYKKAFEIVVGFYNENNKITKEVPKTKMEYDDGRGMEKRSSTKSEDATYNEDDATTSTTKHIQDVLTKMDTKEFNATLNRLFDKHEMGKKIVNRNEWFSAPDGDVSSTHSIASVGDLHKAIEKTKDTQQGMVVYRGVKEMNSSSFGITKANYYDELDEDINEDAQNGEYIEHDVFGKLKFEDIRKVHKNETVFAVKETDYANVPKYDNLEQYQQARVEYQPETKEISEKILRDKEAEIQERMIKKEFEAKKKQMEYEAKNKGVLSYFLQLTR